MFGVVFENNVACRLEGVSCRVISESYPVTIVHEMRGLTALAMCDSGLLTSVRLFDAHTTWL